MHLISAVMAAVHLVVPATAASYASLQGHLNGMESSFHVIHQTNTFPTVISQNFRFEKVRSKKCKQAENFSYFD